MNEYLVQNIIYKVKSGVLMYLMIGFEDIFEPYRTIVIVLYFLLVIGCISIGIITLLISRKPDKSGSTNYLRGIAIFFISFGIARAIFLYHDFFVVSPELDTPLWKLASIIVLVAFSFLNYTIETYVYTKTKHIFSLTGAILTTAYAVIFDKSIATIILYVANILLILLPFIIYIITVKNSTGYIRKNAAIILVGIAILLIAQGSALYMTLGFMDKLTATMFAPPISLIGLTICGYGFISMSRE